MGLTPCTFLSLYEDFGRTCFLHIPAEFYPENGSSRLHGVTSSQYTPCLAGSSFTDGPIMNNILLYIVVEVLFGISN
jgi:hypothetical protein